MAKVRTRRRWLLLLPFLAVGSWGVSHTVGYATSLRLYSIPSGSMSPTLKAGDRVCVETTSQARPKRGEIWVFTSPRGSAFVKRIVGLPGETIEVAAGRVRIDGEPLEELYLASVPSYTMPPVHLAAGEYFLLGDNRNASNDSHVLGPVPEDKFLGRVRYRYWPTRRLRDLTAQGTVRPQGPGATRSRPQPESP